jgi:hypothetical protein
MDLTEIDCESERKMELSQDRVRWPRVGFRIGAIKFSILCERFSLQMKFTTTHEDLSRWMPPFILHSVQLRGLICATHDTQQIGHT